MGIVFILIGVAVSGVVLLVLAAVALWAIGKGLPEEHTASATVTVAAGVPEAFALVSDIAGYPSWADGINKVESLGTQDGAERWRQHMGRNSFVVARREIVPGRELTQTIVDDHGPFTGVWTFRVDPSGTGSAVTLTEVGRIKAALPRAVLKNFFGYDYYLKKFLASVKKKLC